MFCFDTIKFYLLDWNMGACLYGFELLQSRVIALFVAGASRVFLICFGVHYWSVSISLCLVQLFLSYNHKF